MTRSVPRRAPRRRVLALPCPAAAKGCTVKNSIDRQVDGRYEISIEYPADRKRRHRPRNRDWAKHEAADFVELATTGRAAGERRPTRSMSASRWRATTAPFSPSSSAKKRPPAAPIPTTISRRSISRCRAAGGSICPRSSTGERRLAKISALAIADLTKQIRRQRRRRYRLGEGRAGPEWGNFRDFILQKETLEIHYPDYQVAALRRRRTGDRHPARRLQGLTRSDRHAPAASFDCAAAGTADREGDLLRRRRSPASTATLPRPMRTGLEIADDEDAPKESAQVRAACLARPARCRLSEAAVACLTKAYGDRLKTLKTFPD